MTFCERGKIMADIRPFRAIRPIAAKAAEIAALPYDVYNREEAAEETKIHPHSFLAIDRPETQFLPDMELATTDLILPAVRHNLGIGFVPEEFAEEEKKAENVFEIEVEEKLPTRNIILIYDTEYPQSIASKEFQKFLSSQKN